MQVPAEFRRACQISWGWNIGSCESPYMDAGSETQVLYKQCVLLTTEPSLQLWFLEGFVRNASGYKMSLMTKWQFPVDFLLSWSDPSHPGIGSSASVDVDANSVMPNRFMESSVGSTQNLRSSRSFKSPLTCNTYYVLLQWKGQKALFIV